MSTYSMSVYLVGLFASTAYILTNSHFVISENLFVDLICDKFKFSKFCKETLYADSRSEVANHIDIGDIIIDVTVKNASTIAYRIARTPAASKHTIRHLRACKTACNRVVNDMSMAKMFWRSWNVEKSKSIATYNIRNIQHYCMDGFDSIDWLLESFQNLNHLLMIFEDVCDSVHLS